MNSQEIIERIMSFHWDLTACQCWVCRAGRELGYGSRLKYLVYRDDNRAKFPVPSFVQDELPNSRGAGECRK